MESNSKTKEIKYSVLKDYLEGEESQEKQELIASWFDNQDYRFKLEHYLKELWKETDPGRVSSPKGLDVILDRIHHKINILHPKKTIAPNTWQKLPALRINVILKNLARIAAVLLVPLMAFIGYEIIDQKLWAKGQVEVVYNEILCPMGARSHFKLPDGTYGWLNNGSRLKYPVKFSGDYRDVQLSGEAYFHVSENSKRPFIIQTTGLDVKVLGTRLNVHAYPDEQIQSFTLVTGSMELIKNSEGDEITLLKMKPGQHAVYASKDEQIQISNGEGILDDNTIFVGNTSNNKVVKDARTNEIHKINVFDGDLYYTYDETSRYTDWKDGKLILRNDPMPLMLKRIERWYNVRFIITDSQINQYRYWATFEQENLDQVLNMLSLTGPINFEKRPREQIGDDTFRAQEIMVIMKN
jgi:transmembrane sensor